jgi:glyoxylase-like metal-dependent hydrolase (beta-lactamase superfamily II)
MSGWTLDIVEVAVIPDLPYTIYVPDADPAAHFDVPCYCYLLTQPGRCILVDSGPNVAASAAAGFEVVGDPTNALLRALARRERTPDDVEALIHTHLHYDHMQNDALFPHARVTVRERELQWALGRPDRFYAGIDEFLEEVGPRLQIVEGEWDITGGVTLLPNGGHTHGHQSLLVQTIDGPICLCADIVPLGANMRTLPACLDSAESAAFVERLRESGWEWIPGHDPDVRGHARYYTPEP